MLLDLSIASVVNVNSSSRTRRTYVTILVDDFSTITDRPKIVAAFLGNFSTLIVSFRFVCSTRTCVSNIKRHSSKKKKKKISVYKQGLSKRTLLRIIKLIFFFLSIQSFTKLALVFKSIKIEIYRKLCQTRTYYSQQVGSLWTIKSSGIYLSTLPQRLRYPLRRKSLVCFFEGTETFDLQRSPMMNEKPYLCRE